MNYENLKDMVRQNNGILYASTARSIRYDNKMLQRLEASGELERISRVY